MGAQHTLAFQHQPHQLGVAIFLLVEQRLATDEITVIQHQGPAHVGFPGGNAVVHVVAVQVHAGFQPQGVTGTEAGRGHTGGQQLIPQRHRIGTGQHDLYAVFPGVAGAGNHPFAVFGKAKHLERLYRLGAGAVEQAGGDVPGLGALDGQHGQIGTLTNIHRKPTGMLFHPGQVGFAGRAIYHQPVVIVAFVNDQVVDHTTALIEHAAVKGTTRGNTVDIVGQQVAQVVAGTGAGHFHNRHVRDIEDASLLAHGMVFLDLGAVIDRHVPAAEIHHLAASGQVSVI